MFITLSVLSVTYKHYLSLLNWSRSWCGCLLDWMARRFSVHMDCSSSSMAHILSWFFDFTQKSLFWGMMIAYFCHLVMLSCTFYWPYLEKASLPSHNRTNYKWVSVFGTLDCERHKSKILCDIKFNKCSIPIKLCHTAEHLCRDMKVGSF